MPYRTKTNERQAAGKRSHYVTFQLRTTAKDSFNAEVENWDTVAFYEWAECQGLGSREFPAHQRVNNESTARFVLPYHAGVDPATYRILDDGEIWNISKPIPNAEKSYMTIEARQVE